jgi:hypothetical protein
VARRALSVLTGDLLAASHGHAAARAPIPAGDLPLSLRSNLVRPDQIQWIRFIHTPLRGKFVKEPLMLNSARSPWVDSNPDFELFLIRKLVRIIYKTAIEFVLLIKTLF